LLNEDFHFLDVARRLGYPLLQVQHLGEPLVEVALLKVFHAKAESPEALLGKFVEILLGAFEKVLLRAHILFAHDLCVGSLGKQDDATRSGVFHNHAHHLPFRGELNLVKQIKDVVVASNLHRDSGLGLFCKNIADLLGCVKESDLVRRLALVQLLLGILARSRDHDVMTDHHVDPKPVQVVILPL